MKEGSTKNMNNQSSLKTMYWIKLLKNGSLPKLRVWQLDKYLEHFMLSNTKNFKKQQKLRFIQKHIVSNNNIEQNEVVTAS